MVRKYAFRSVIGLVLVIAAAMMIAGWWLNNDRVLTALAKNYYWEAIAAHEPPIAARMVGHVTRNRAAANRSYWGGSDIHDVVHARKTNRRGITVCQFTWTCLKAAKSDPANEAMWNLALQYAKDEMAGKFVPPAHLRGATSYLNPKWSGRKNICEFKTKLVYLGKAEPESKHEFYRDPANAAEKASLPNKKDVAECQPRKKPVPAPRAQATRKYATR